MTTLVEQAETTLEKTGKLKAENKRNRNDERMDMLVLEREAWIKNTNRSRIAGSISAQMGKLFPSDPFLKNKIASNLHNNIAVPGDHNEVTVIRAEADTPPYDTPIRTAFKKIMEIHGPLCFYEISREEQVA